MLLLLYGAESVGHHDAAGLDVVQLAALAGLIDAEELIPDVQDEPDELAEAVGLVADMVAGDIDAAAVAVAVLRVGIDVLALDDDFVLNQIAGRAALVALAVMGAVSRFHNRFKGMREQLADFLKVLERAAAIALVADGGLFGAGCRRSGNLRVDEQQGAA